jgi:hypothetical protein
MAEKVQLEIEVKGGDSVGKASEMVQRLRSQLKEMKAELASGNLSTEAFNKLSIKAGELQDRIGDVNQRVKNLASDSGKLDGFVSVATGIAGGFAAAQGAIALFGDENQDLQKTLVKVQGAVAVLNGFQAVANTLNKDSAAMTQLVAIKTKIAEFAQRRYAMAVGQTTGMIKAARVAGVALAATLAATGIGALIMGISMLIPKIMDWVKATRNQADEQERLNDQLNTTEEWTNNAIKLNDHYTKLAVERAKQRGASESEVFEIERKGREKNIEETKKYYNELKAEFDSFNVEKYEDAEKAEEAYNDLSNKMGAVYAKQQDLENAEVIKNEEFKTNVIKKQKEASEKARNEAEQKEIKRLEAEAARLKQFRENAEQQQKDSFEKAKQIEKDRIDYENEQQEIQDQYDEAVILREKEQLEQRVADEIAAGEQLNQAKWAAGMAGVSIAQQLAGKNKAAADALFAIEKGLAIAQVIVNTQKEIAGYYANPTWSLLPDGGAAIKTSYAVGAKVRAATSIATIAASAIGRYSSSGGNSGGGGGSTPQNQNPNVQGFSTTNTRTNQTGDTGSQRVYVTETDISNVINKVSRIKMQATVE